MSDLQLSARDRLGGNLLYALARITGRTGRFAVDGEHHLRALQAEGRPLIYGAWHGMTMMLVGSLPLLGQDWRRFVLILPDDWRGAALSQFVQRLGAMPFPMNVTGDASMGAARRLLALTRLIKEGINAYVTPDGPDGPAFVVKPGLAYMAQKSGAPIVPVAGFTRRGYRLNRWDEYVVPYPYSRIQIAIGAPITVPRDATLDNAGEQITDALHRVAARAMALYYQPEAG